MMYICKDCGHIFEEGEQKIIVEHHPYGMTTADERFSVCPVCNGGYEEAVIYEACGGAFDPDDERMVGKWCKDCLLGMVDYDLFKKYLEDDATRAGGGGVSDLEWFFFRDLWGMNKYHVCNLDSSLECKADLFSLYDAYVEGDKLDEQFTGKHPFLDKIKAFVSEDLYVFADWLEGEEKNGSV
jgi:hypothetical protein